MGSGFEGLPLPEGIMISEGEAVLRQRLVE